MAFLSWETPTWHNLTFYRYLLHFVWHGHDTGTVCRQNFCLKLTVIKFLIRIRARPEEFWRYHKVWLLDEPSPQSSVSQRQEGADHWQILLLIDWLLHGLKYKRLWMLWLHHKICDIVKINVFISTRTKRHKLQRPEMTLYSKCTTYPIPSQLFSGS